MSIIIGNDHWKIITGGRSDWVGSQFGIILWELEMSPCCIVKCRLQHAFSHIFEIELHCPLKELRRRSSHCKQQIVEDWMPIGYIYIKYLCVVLISWHVMFVVGVCNNGIKVNSKKEEKASTHHEQWQKHGWIWSISMQLCLEERYQFGHKILVGC